MTNEQEKALYRLDVHSKYATSNGEVVVNKSDIDAVLSLIKEQQEEIKNLQKELNEENKRCMILANNDKFKEQVIDLMAEYIATLDIEEDICANIENDNCDKMAFGECEDCIKQYFAGLVEEE